MGNNLDLAHKLVDNVNSELLNAQKNNTNLLPHDDHIDDVEKIFFDGKYKKLLLYAKFDIGKIFDNLCTCETLMQEKYSKVVKHIIDNCKDLNYTMVRGNSASKNLIHLICRNYTSNVIQYAINKEGINLEYCDNNGHRTIHIICLYGSVDDLRCIIDKGANIDSDLINFIEKYECGGKRDKITLIRAL